MLRFIVLMFSFYSFQAIAEGTLQEIKLDKKIAMQHGFSINYEINEYGNVFIVAVFPGSTEKNYKSSSSIVTIKLASGGAVSFNDDVKSGENSHKTEVIFENEKDFIDASISIAYHCKTVEGLICRGRHYTIRSIRQWQAN